MIVIIISLRAPTYLECREQYIGTVDQKIKMARDRINNIKILFHTILHVCTTSTIKPEAEK